MRIRKPKKTEITPSGASKARLTDDGLNDGKAGKTPLAREVFETAVDYHIYKDAYDRGLAVANPPKVSRPHSRGSGIW